MLLLAVTACEGGNSSDDTLSRVDVIVPSDPGSTDDVSRDTPPPRDLPPADPGTTDPGIVDPGTTDPGTQDTGTIDVGPTDVGSQDPGATDSEPADLGSQDTGTTDVGPEDVPAPTDLPPADVPPFECTGTCDPSTQTTQCMPDGLTICYCNPDSGNWEPYGCGDVCTANGMVGTACILGENGDPTCDCTFDCSRSDLVATQCDQLYYTPCTCGAADPCNWIGDGFCDADCAVTFPDDHLVDTADCTCGGACDPQQFSEYCDLDRNPCQCGTEGTQVTLNCDAYCSDQAGVPNVQERCTVFYGMAFCNCQDWTCEDPAKVANQCDAGVRTPCTCGAADPCGWIGDGYCDSAACNSLYPDQQNLDDSAQDCQG